MFKMKLNEPSHPTRFHPLERKTIERTNVDHGERLSTAKRREPQHLDDSRRADSRELSLQGPKEIFAGTPSARA